LLLDYIACLGHHAKKIIDKSFDSDIIAIED
jgi:hypothetical protein